MKISAKGQVTVPRAYRERFGLKPGVEIDIMPEGAGLHIEAKQPAMIGSGRFEHWLANAAGSALPSVTTDQIMAMTRGED